MFSTSTSGNTAREIKIASVEKDFGDSAKVRDQAMIDAFPLEFIGANSKAKGLAWLL